MKTNVATIQAGVSVSDGKVTEATGMVIVPCGQMDLAMAGAMALAGQTDGEKVMVQEVQDVALKKRKKPDANIALAMMDLSWSCFLDGMINHEDVYKNEAIIWSCIDEKEKKKLYKLLSR